MSSIYTYLITFFLHFSHFLAPGTSYAKFLKAYGVEEAKGFFPYEWLDDVTKLEHTELPPHEAFYSSLKGSNISDEEYAYCQKEWEDRNMSTFRDFLIWYNNLDVGPFVTAVERLQTFYFQKGIDVLKTAMSVPGIARQLLFQAARKQSAEFSLIDKNNADLLHTTISSIGMRVLEHFLAYKTHESRHQITQIALNGQNPTTHHAI